MNVSNINKKIKNLKQIKEIIEISKFDTLHKLQKAKKITETYFDIALLSKQLVSFAQKEYFIKSSLRTKKNKGGVTWIFATIKSTLMSTSYDVQEKILLKHFDYEKDRLIVIGKPAIEFAKKRKIAIYYELDDIEMAISRLPIIISTMQQLGNKDSVKFISNSVYSGQEPITILPMANLNLNYKGKITDVKGYKFLPSISETIASLSDIYIERIIKGLLRETKYLYLKEKLIRHEGSINTVEDKIDKNISCMNKENRKIETEELIHITQIAKRGETNG